MDIESSEAPSRTPSSVGAPQIIELETDAFKSPALELTRVESSLLEASRAEPLRESPDEPRPRDERQWASRSWQRTLIVGSCETARRLADELEHHFPDDFQILGFVADDDEECDEAIRLPIVGRRDELRELVRHYRADRVMFANCVDPQLDETGLQPRALRDRRAGALEHGFGGSGRFTRDRRREIADLYLQATSPAFVWPHARRARLYALSKRAFDIGASIGALTLTAPLAVLILPLIKLTSPGPVFYLQERVGQGGKPFTIYKLRTMRLDAERDGPTLSPRGDSRSTLIGRFLRVTKLDEVPQFWNVLRGDMSVIGPRPERPFFVDPFCGHIYSYQMRHSVRPGLTGLAQIKGDHLTHVYVKLHYDLSYVVHRRMSLDFVILAQTPWVIIRNILRRTA